MPTTTTRTFMRSTFHADLRAVLDDLVVMTRMAGTAIERATRSLVEADVTLADSVIAADVELDALREDVDARSIDLLARQAPVATDLRTIVTSMRMSADLERMGDLARHVALVTRMRYPERAVPDELTATILEMADACGRIVGMAGDVIASRDGSAVDGIEAVDDELDHRHRELFTRMLGPDWTHGTQAAVDVTLLSRYYERFGDHGVSVARRVRYLVTGERDGWLEGTVGEVVARGGQ